MILKFSEIFFVQQIDFFPDLGKFKSCQNSKTLYSKGFQLLAQNWKRQKSNL